MPAALHTAPVSNIFSELCFKNLNIAVVFPIDSTLVFPFNSALCKMTSLVCFKYICSQSWLIFRLARSLHTSYDTVCCMMSVTWVACDRGPLSLQRSTRHQVSAPFSGTRFLKYKVSCSSNLLWFSLDSCCQTVFSDFTVLSDFSIFRDCKCQTYISDSLKSPLALWFNSTIAGYNIVLLKKQEPVSMLQNLYLPVYDTY